MSATPFMQLYVADYFGDTKHLSIEQHGAYLVLLMTMWQAGGSLPNDETKLARILGLSPAKWRRIAGDVMAFFTVSDGHITQKRLTAEIEKAKEKSIKRADAGARGGQAKALNNKNVALANATILPPTLPQHLPEPEPEPEKKKERKSSDADASGADAPSIDPKTILFRQGLPLLAGLTGKPEAALRAVLGRWLKLTGNDCGAVLTEIERCRGSPVANPVSWIEARLKPKAQHEQPRSGHDKAFAALAAYVGAAEGVDEFRWGGDAPRRDEPDDRTASGAVGMRPIIAAAAGGRH